MADQTATADRGDRTGPRLPLVRPAADGHSPRMLACSGTERPPPGRHSWKGISAMDENKRNLQYFEAQSMEGLFDALQVWQVEHEKRFMALDIQNDHGKFCCIALTNPTEVVIVGKSEVVIVGKGGNNDAHVAFGKLQVHV
jgi:hypothetical protein